KTSTPKSARLFQIIRRRTVGWRVKRAVALHEADLAGSRFGMVWLWLLRFLVPVTILAILLQSASML
ncbi:MAG: hypothetical protein O3B08_13985, partial [Proteobacteria bacterium]|nr:hypothetical protein [Pseudomonadota bacterium]